MRPIANAHHHIDRLLELLAMERRADLEQYRAKVTNRSLQNRVKEGSTWYPVRLRRNYVGTGERNILELERTNHLEQAHLFQSGKTVNIFSNGSGKPERDHLGGVVNYVSDNVITITINSEDLPDWIDDSLLGIDVMFDEMTYREMEYALKTVAKAEDSRLAVLRDLFMGDSDLQTAKEKMQPVENWATDRPAARMEGLTAPLNDPQKRAVDISQIAPAVSLVHGPPGTGKTTTLVEIICNTLKSEKQVLVSAPSNAAIDLLVEKLSDRGLMAVRIGHPARVTEHSLSKTLDARITAHSEYPELRRMRKKIEEIRSRALKFKRNFGWAEKEERRLLLQESKAVKADADLLEFYIVNELLNQADAICCTLTGASHPLLKGRRFRTLFIDEAAQALEPGCWIPLLKAERVVLAGDHCQLPPTVKSREASAGGLGRTLFERLIEKFPDQATMLRVQYRMHRDIMAFPSAWFYEDRLLAHPSVAGSLLRPNQSPVTFIDTAGTGYREEQDPETLSRFNEEEAALAIKMAEQLVEEIGTEHWLEEGLTLGLITPYSAQVERLRKLAEASDVLEPLHKLATINTVDAFQGQERDVIIISFVRSNDQAEVGFLSDIRRTNVAMTRARRKLIMIGDSATLAAHPFYDKLIGWFQEKEFYRSAFEQ
ncbi:MAG: AAA domain-containing protein [Bacteroidota bacterium]